MKGEPRTAGAPCAGLPSGGWSFWSFTGFWWCWALGLGVSGGLGLVWEGGRFCRGFSGFRNLGFRSGFLVKATSPDLAPDGGGL